VLANPRYPDIVIDEVQRVPELLPLVHRLVEMKLGSRFVLTGSSVRKLKSADVDLLGGRAVRKSMYPFMLSELPQPQDLGESIEFGLLPVALYSADKAATLDAYISLYMQQEVCMLKDNILCLPVDDFLKRLRPNEPLAAIIAI